MTFSTSRADQPADGRRELSARARSVLRTAWRILGISLWRKDGTSFAVGFVSTPIVNRA